MTIQQKRAAAFISFGLVGLASAFMMWIAVLVIFDSGPMGDKFPGRFLMLLFHNSDFTETALKSLPFLITLGVGILAKYKLKDWLYYGTVSVSLLGAAAAVYLLVELSAIDTSKRFWQYSPVIALEDYHSFVTATRSSLIPFTAWFIGVLGIQLGIKTNPGAQNNDG